VYVFETKAAVGYCSTSSLEDENDPRDAPWCAAVCRVIWDRAGDGFVLFLGKSRSKSRSSVAVNSDESVSISFIQLSRCRNTHRLSVAYLFVRDVP
jgi:hypothetical protein